MRGSQFLSQSPTGFALTATTSPTNLFASISQTVAFVNRLAVFPTFTVSCQKFWFVVVTVLTIYALAPTFADLPAQVTGLFWR